MSYSCQNCGAHVTDDYMRVRSRRDEDEPEACPQCEYKTRVGATVRDTRNKRRQGNSKRGQR